MAHCFGYGREPCWDCGCAPQACECRHGDVDITPPGPELTLDEARAVHKAQTRALNAIFVAAWKRAAKEMSK